MFVPHLPPLFSYSHTAFLLFPTQSNETKNPDPPPVDSPGVSFLYIDRRFLSCGVPFFFDFVEAETSGAWLNGMSVDIDGYEVGKGRAAGGDGGFVWCLPPPSTVSARFDVIGVGSRKRHDRKAGVKKKRKVT